ncbi:MAG TPA: hypothetical protein VFS69_01980 [Sphingomicrobium sp.]|jgi:hypothetical protein|nr:hypothetical protein [Sphingomicrobium sp.]
MSFLSKLLAEREYFLPPFDLAPLAFELQSPEEGELLLDRVVSTDEGQANIVALSGPVPTAGELRNSIERHLDNARGVEPTPADAIDELRSALAELRRSLR